MYRNTQIYTNIQKYSNIHKHSNTKLYEIPSSGSRVVPCGHTDRQTDRYVYMTKLTVTFQYFANAPKNQQIAHTNHVLYTHMIFPSTHFRFFMLEVDSRNMSDGKSYIYIYIYI